MEGKEDPQIEEASPYRYHQVAWCMGESIIPDASKYINFCINKENTKSSEFDYNNLNYFYARYLVLSWKETKNLVIELLGSLRTVTKEWSKCFDSKEHLAEISKDNRITFEHILSRFRDAFGSRDEDSQKTLQQQVYDRFVWYFENTQGYADDLIFKHTSLLNNYNLVGQLINKCTEIFQQVVDQHGHQQKPLTKTVQKLWRLFAPELDHRPAEMQNALVVLNRGNVGKLYKSLEEKNQVQYDDEWYEDVVGADYSYVQALKFLCMSGLIREGTTIYTELKETEYTQKFDLLHMYAGLFDANFWANNEFYRQIRKDGLKGCQLPAFLIDYLRETQEFTVELPLRVVQFTQQEFVQYEEETSSSNAAVLIALFAVAGAILFATA